MELTDGGITIRHATVADAHAVARAVHESLETLVPWMPWATVDYCEDDAIAWARDEITPGSEGFVIVDDAGEIIGTTGLHPFDDDNLVVELGYWIHPEHTGRGAASTAARLLARHAIENRGAARVEVLMSVENVASRRVAEKAGATYEGVLRERLLLHGRRHDVHMWAFLASDSTAGPTTGS